MLSDVWGFPWGFVFKVLGLDGKRVGFWCLKGVFSVYGCEVKFAEGSSSSSSAFGFAFVCVCLCLIFFVLTFVCVCLRLRLFAFVRACVCLTLSVRGFDHV